MGRQRARQRARCHLPVRQRTHRHSFQGSSTGGLHDKLYARNHASGCAGVQELFKYYSVPSDVLTERMRSVNHAFGSSQAIESEAQISWCHFLCRQIEVYDGTIKRFDYLLDEKQNLSKSSNALNLWIMCDFFLHVTKDRSVTLLCFGVPPTIVLRFEKLLAKASWDDVLEEPFLLFVIILDELHDIFNSLSTILAVALRKVEEAAISQAGAPSLNFHQLHEIQKWVLSPTSKVVRLVCER
jgi:hypothetical protein